MAYLSEKIKNQLRYLPLRLFVHPFSYFWTGLLGRLSHLEWKAFKNALISSFNQLYKVDVQEAQSPDYRQYPHFNAWFTRRLKKELRPWSQENKALCSPVDGRVIQLGDIEDGQMFPIKGQSLSLAELFSGDLNEITRFRGGKYAILYLSPTDCHRFYMPVSGNLLKTYYIPGSLSSVSPLTVRMLPKLFAKNERALCFFSSDLGPMAFISVGAVGVASIQLMWQGVLRPKKRGKIEFWDYANQEISFARGEELGHFNMGSTVILLLSSKGLGWEKHLKAGSKVRIGEKIASA